MKWPVCIYYTDIQICMFFKYKDEYQKSKWTIECRTGVLKLFEQCQKSLPIFLPSQKNHYQKSKKKITIDENHSFMLLTIQNYLLLKIW